MMIALIGFNANAALYIVGDAPFAGWHTNSGTPMVENGDGTWSYTVTIENKNVYFSFCDGFTDSDQDWDNFVAFRYGPTSDGQVVNSDGNWVNTQHAGYAYKFYGNGEYVFTFDPNNGEPRFKIEGYVPPVEITTYSVTSELDNWSGNNADYDMTLANGVYTWSGQNIELRVGNFEYKIVGNHDWGFEWPQGYGNNFEEAVATHGYYDITITFDPATEESTCTLTLVEEIEDPIIENHTYTVAGSSTTLFGSEWDPTDTNNDMTLVNGLYTWTKNNVTLTAGTIEFKVVMDHNWNNGANAWPSQNWVANIENEGNYDVVITFNDSTKDITFTATEAVVVDDFYTVAGAPESLFGEEWNPEYAANNMVLDAETGLYTWTREDVELAANTFIEFKVVKNANWDTCWPENNYEYTCPADGIYDLTITYNPETNQVLFTHFAQGEEPEMVYTVVGPESIFGTNWDVNDEANNMAEGANGVYTWSKENVTLYGNFDFKVVGNHSYEIYQWPLTGNWTAIVAEEGVYTIEIAFDPEADAENRIACNLTKTGNITPVEHVYTVAGTENLFGSNWSATDEANNMVKGENGVYTWTKKGVEFALNDEVEFKVVQDHGWTYAWPSNNWYWKCEDAGKYDVVITFDPTADDMNKITFTATKQTVKVGDITGEGDVNMDDLTALINYLLTGNGEGMNLDNAAACDGQDGINMDDLTALINYLLTNTWPTPPAVEHVYTVAGTLNLCGSYWEVNDPHNDMVKGDDGIYRLNMGGYFQEGETAEFKIVEDHSWDHSWPADNVLLYFSETGAYNIGIAFDPTADQEYDIIRVSLEQIP